MNHDMKTDEQIAREAARQITPDIGDPRDPNNKEQDRTTALILVAIAEAKQQNDDTARQIQNLAVLIVRLCSKDTGHSQQLRTRALDYLKREGLIPSPLRSEQESAPAAERVLLREIAEDNGCSPAQEKPVAASAEEIAPDVAVKLIAVRDALIANDVAEAWHQLYAIVDPSFLSLNPWQRIEQVAGLAAAASPSVGAEES